MDKQTRLPIVKEGLFAGLTNSNYEPQEVFNDLVLTNPNVAQYVSGVNEKFGEGAARACLLLYKMLDTQAECDELRAGN